MLSLFYKMKQSKQNTRSTLDKKARPGSPKQAQNISQLLEMKQWQLDEDEEDEDEEDYNAGPPDISESEHESGSDNDWFSSDNGGYQDEDFDSYGEDDSDNPMSGSELKKPPKGYRNRMVSWCNMTHYDIVKEVLKFGFNYHLTRKARSDWDLAWWDGPPPIQLLPKMQPWQRVNHFPGIFNLARKNLLGRHLMRMGKEFPEDYNFFPLTFMLPHDYKEFMAILGEKRNKTFICKPENNCQGKGIFLTRNPDIMPKTTSNDDSQQGDQMNNEHMVVQRYLTKPYLIDGFKFDLRLYVLVNGISPLRVYLYNDGLARFATVPYEIPNPKNMTNLFMHLTNYAINKDSENFVQYDDESKGSKRSYTSVLKLMRDAHGNAAVDLMQQQINDIIVKTMCIAQPHVHHLYRSSQPDDLENQICFQILGFDVIIDANLKPILLEVNQMPSFQTDSALDLRVKRGVITDAVAILNLSKNRRYRSQLQKKQDQQRRLMNKYQVVTTEEKKKALATAISNVSDKSVQKHLEMLNQKRMMHLQEKNMQRRKKRLTREKYEFKVKGGYELIFPKVSYQEEELIRQHEKGKENFTSADVAAIVERIQSEETEQGLLTNPLINLSTLAQRWSQDEKHVSFMEGAKCLWENFVSGASEKKKKEKKEPEPKVLSRRSIEKEALKATVKKELIKKLQEDQENRKAVLQNIKLRKELTAEEYQTVIKSQLQARHSAIEEDQREDDQSPVLQNRKSIECFRQVVSAQTQHMQIVEGKEIKIDRVESPTRPKQQKKEEAYIPTNYYLRHHKNLQKVKNRQQNHQEEEFKDPEQQSQQQIISSLVPTQILHERHSDQKNINIKQTLYVDTPTQERKPIDIQKDFSVAQLIRHDPRIPRMRNNSKSEQHQSLKPEPNFRAAIFGNRKSQQPQSYKPESFSPIKIGIKAEALKQIKKSGIVEQVQKFLVSETVTPEIHVKNITFNTQTAKNEERSRNKYHNPVEMSRCASQDQGFPHINQPKSTIAEPFDSGKQSMFESPQKIRLGAQMDISSQRVNSMGHFLSESMILSDLTQSHQHIKSTSFVDHFQRKKFSVGDIEQIMIGTSRLKKNTKLDTSGIFPRQNFVVGNIGMMNQPVMTPFQRNQMVFKVQTIKKSKIQLAEENLKFKRNLMFDVDLNK